MTQTISEIIEELMNSLDDVVIGKSYRSDFKESLKQKLEQVVEGMPEHIACCNDCEGKNCLSCEIQDYKAKLND